MALGMHWPWGQKVKGQRFIESPSRRSTLQVITTTDLFLYTVSKNDTNVAHYNFNAHQPIFVIFGRAAAERMCYRTVIWYSASPN